VLKKIKKLPSSPGIYQYFNKDGRLLYIGKAKNLKNRVKSYFNFSDTLTPSKTLSPRIYKMISECVELEYIVVANEHDALILENSLIKQLKPKYNILLRDDKTYPYIYIDLNDKFPRFEITRKIIDRPNIKYFGPYSSGSRDTLQSIYELLPLVQKKSCINGKKKCLFYEINRCLAPCEDLIDEQQYSLIVKQGIKLLRDKNSLISLLKEHMNNYSKNLHFEEAAKLRDRVKSIKNSTTTTSIDIKKIESFDIFAISLAENIACAVKLFIRSGRVISSDHIIFKSEYGFDKNELYHRVILSHYNKEIPYVPQTILVYEEFNSLKSLQSLISTKHSKKVAIKVPKIGDKRRVTSIAKNNAQELIRVSNDTNRAVLRDIKDLLGLQNIPNTIEGYDNSHMMGSVSVGAIIKWDEKFIKSSYKHYNLNSKNEYEQMEELITKRVHNLEHNPLPDLIVLDGGDALLRLVVKTIKQKGVFVDIIAIAKEKREKRAVRSKSRAEDIIYTIDGEFRLSSDDKRLHFIQNIRDESHRFAINFFKRQKAKEDKKLSLLKKRGVGEATIKKLLNYFGTFENIQRASLNELKGVIGSKRANIVKN
jgi:excinuclease ABC subunit C